METKHSRKSNNSRDQILKLEKQLQIARQKVIDDVIKMEAEIEADIYKIIRLSLTTGVPQGNKDGPMVHYTDLINNITAYCNKLVLMIDQGRLNADSPDEFQNLNESKYGFEDQPE